MRANVPVATCVLAAILLLADSGAALGVGPGGAGIAGTRVGGGGFAGGAPSARSFNSSSAGSFSGRVANGGPSTSFRAFGGNPSASAKPSVSRSTAGAGPNVAAGAATTRAGRGGGSPTFLKNNFPYQGAVGSTAIPGAQRIEANRPNNVTFGRTPTHGNSFIRSQNINNNNPNHWTHNHGKWDKGNWNNNGNSWHKGNWAGNHQHHKHGKNVFFSPFFAFGTGPLWGGWGWPYYGWSYGYGYPLYAWNLYDYPYYPYYASYTAMYAAAPANAQAAVNQVQTAAADDFANQGEADFKAGRYQDAARQWQHALVDDPKNGGLMMLLAQALFALGKYDEAAGAVQAAMQMLPQDKWGVVISNYAQLYGNVQDYTNQVRALEKARTAQPDSPALRFLLGFHFGYLGYPKHAVGELDVGMTLLPGDFAARTLRDIFAAKWPQAPPLPAAAVEAAKEFEKQTGRPPGVGPAPPAARSPAGTRPASPPAPSKQEPGTPA
jgi:tetratricopeptide (TPR) repeat protein